MDKIYFNLTKIMNGWVLNYSPSFPDEGTMTPTPQEEYFKTFVEAYGFIASHVEAVQKFDSKTLRHLFKDDNARELKLDYILKLREQGLLK